MTRSALAYLLERLALEPVAPGVFRDAGGEDPLHRLFGGEVAAQALVAMGRTVAADRPVHSFHARFVRPGRTGVPIELRVETVKAGRSFDLRGVELRQEGALILTATASFQLPEPGPRYPAPAALDFDPESLPRWEDRFGDRRDRLSPLWTRSRPIDLRYVDPPPPLDPHLHEGHRRGQTTLVRADGPLPEDPLLHAATVVYASDMTLLETALLPLGAVYADGHYDGASLDHTMWFHRPPRADRWLRYDQTAEAMTGGRGLTSGRLSDATGTLVATVLQEGLLRPTHGTGSWLAGTAPDRTMPGEDR